MSKRLFPALFGCLCLTYAFAFVFLRLGVWFNPLTTSDDGYQQLTPLYDVLFPGRFAGDLPTEVMRGYLPPLHWALSVFFTKLTMSPIMAGHWVMFVQIVLSAIFLFLATRRLSSTGAGCVAVIWFLHCHPIWIRMAGGLPRGWLAVLVVAGLYAIVSRRHWLTLAVMGFGCFLNPPGTFLIGLAYGYTLLLDYGKPETRKQAFRAFIALCVAAPIFAFVLLKTIERPPEIGPMVTLEEASKMPAFDRRGGRFNFLPFSNPAYELTRYGFRLYAFRNIPKLAHRQAGLVWIALAILLGLAVRDLKKGTRYVPQEILCLLLAILTAYFLSRALAFRLYVPDRYIFVPLNLLWIVAIPSIVWRLLQGAQLPQLETLRTKAALVALPIILFTTSGWGLGGAGGINVFPGELMPFYAWLRDSTDTNISLMSHPRRIDGVPLFGIRRAFITAETAHPFYPIYYKEVERRIEISLRAYYARTWDGLANLVKNENVRYLAFFRSDYPRSGVKEGRFFKPFKAMVKQLTSYEPEQYIGWRLFYNEKESQSPFIVYKDSEVVVIDLAKLRESGSTEQKI